jgi:hypothetical protein
MAIRDQAAAFLSQLNPAMQAAGSDIARKGASAMGQFGNQLANMGAPVGVATGLQSGGAALNAMGPGAQTALGYGTLAAGTIATGATAAAVSQLGKKNRERLAGKNLGAQLGVQMPGVI